MIENLDLSDIPAEHELSNLSKQSSLRQLHDQTQNINGTLNSQQFAQQQQLIPIMNQSASKKLSPNNYNNTSQGQIVSPYIMQSPSNQNSNAPLPPNFKRENANNTHVLKRSRQPIFSAPYQSNSLSRNQSPSQHVYVQHNTSSGSLSGTKNNPIFPSGNQNSSLNQIKTDSFHTCAEQSNNFSQYQHQNSLLFRKINEQNQPAPLQSPYLNLDKQDSESFLSVNSNQNINIPNQNQTQNTNLHQITRRIFSSTTPSQPLQKLSPKKNQQFESPDIQSIESKQLGQDTGVQMHDLRSEMMKYAECFFESLKRDVQDNSIKIQEVEQTVLDHQTDLRNKYLDENRVKAKPTKVDNALIQNYVEQVVSQILKRFELNNKDLQEQIQSIKKDVKVKLDQSFSEALRGRAANTMIENKLDILKSDLEVNQRQKIEVLTARCLQLESNYQNSQLFEDLNEFARNRANIYENKLLNLENLLNQFKKSINEKINIGDIKGQFKEIVDQKAQQIQDQIDELKLLPQFSNNTIQFKNDSDLKLKQLERNLNEKLYSLDAEQKLLINTKPDFERQNKLDEKIMRFNQDMKVLQNWYMKLNQDFSKIRVNNESNEKLLKQFEEINERINVLNNQQNRILNSEFKYESNELEGIYNSLQKLAKNLHQIDEYKKQKFDLLEKKLNSSKEEMDKKIQNLIQQINLNKQPLSTLSSLPGIKIKIKQPDSSQKQKSLPSTDSNLTIYQTNNSTQKSVSNTIYTQGLIENAQFSSENYSKQNSVVSSANNSYVYNQKQQPFVHPPSRAPLQITQMSSTETGPLFEKTKNAILNSQKDGISDEQILINSNKHLSTKFSQNISKQITSPDSSSQKQNSELRPTHNKFSEQFNDDDEDFEEFEPQKVQKIFLNAESSEGEEEDIQKMKNSTLKKQNTDQQKQLQQKYNDQGLQQQGANNKISQYSLEKNRFQTYSIPFDGNEIVSENINNPLENKLKQSRSDELDYNIGQKTLQDQLNKISNKQLFMNQDNQFIQKSGVSNDSDPINFDFVDGCQKSSISSRSSNATTPFNRIPQHQNQQQDQNNNGYNIQNSNLLTVPQNIQRSRQSSTGSNYNINNKIENPYLDYNSFQQINQQLKQQELFIKQHKESTLPNLMEGNSNYQSLSKIGQSSQQTPQFNQQLGFNSQKQQEQKNKSDSSFATPAGSLNNSYEIDQDKNQQQNVPQQIQQSNHNKLQKSQIFKSQNHDLKNLKNSQNIKTPDQSQNLEDLLDQFEDFNEHNIDAMSSSGEFYENDDEGDEEMYSQQNSTPNSKFKQTQGLSTLKNIQLNQINEEDNEEECSNLGFSYANQNKISINSQKNNIRESDQLSSSKLKNSTNLQECIDVLNSVKMQNNIYKIIDQITRLLELKNEKKLRCYRDEVGYLKDANGFYIFDTEGRMIKTDKDTINFIKTDKLYKLNNFDQIKNKMEEREQQMYLDISQKIVAQIKNKKIFNTDNILEIFYLLKNSKYLFRQYDYIEDNQTYITFQATCEEESTLFALQIFKYLKQDENFAEKSNPEINYERKKLIKEEIKDKNYWINVYHLNQFIDTKIYYEEDLNDLDEAKFSAIKSINLEQNKNKQEDKKIVNQLKQYFTNIQSIRVGYKYDDIPVNEIANLTQRIIAYNKLQSLTISFWRCNIQEQAIQQLLIDIKDLKMLSTLQLNFIETQIDNSGCLDIANNIKKLKNLKCISLFVWDRSIQQINKAFTKKSILKIKYLVKCFIFFK
ncbi:hypothetical protein TTHERM_00316580 (macronuclear) [Tetrahymena thermophila SB210]|uniref:Uncharacterized protein n=1 Tax=Tetrahymena thermophila (strain SB210) TaxID=312017 RepID=I7LW76_TETTS|nr:hypothetical protein TTHERM_00316580 [Tetrahymena thermophila SB210]EAS01105.2 hypothetical protein TTHERM_00316580 [Tetrahymena thermophila SB210]|eukprot:XP_001021350.2 hypothetical protein TTHERM_00316580 [Tetrahymena thermophila SB210]